MIELDWESFPNHFLLHFACGNDQVDIANVMARVFCSSFHWQIWLGSFSMQMCGNWLVSSSRAILWCNLLGQIRKLFSLM